MKGNTPKRLLKYLGCLLSAAFCIGLLAWMIHYIVPAIHFFRETLPDVKEPLLMLAFLVGGLLLVAGGIILAVVQRIRELRKGEEEDAKKY